MISKLSLQFFAEMVNISPAALLLQISEAATQVCS